MIHELIVTSAKRVLQAGRSGFATVMRTRGMHPELQSRLESLSGYRHLFPQGDPRNPVIQTYNVIDSVAGKFSVFSRTGDAGSDYSGRSNKLSHHVAIDAPEIRNAVRSSPAAVLQWLEHNGRFASRWEGDPREQESSAPVIFPPSDPKTCTAWETAAGDAGWAGVLVQRTLKGLPTWIVVPAETDAVRLFVEAMAIMEPTKRWAVSFTTHAMSDAAFLWKVAAEGSAEAKHAREQQAAAVIDITHHKKADDDGAYTQAARGIAEVPWKKAPAARPSAHPAPATPPQAARGDLPTGPALSVDPRHRATATRPAPPPIVKPPPVVRSPDAVPHTMSFPAPSRHSQGSTAVIAAAVATGLVAAALVGLLVDERMRGDESVVRKVAALMPREASKEKPKAASGGAGDVPQTQVAAVATDGDKSGEQADAEIAADASGGKNGDSASSPTSTASSPQPPAKDTDRKPTQSQQETTTNKESPEQPGASKTVVHAASPTTPPNAAKDKPAAPGVFQPVHDSVESQGHLPVHSLANAASDSSEPRRATCKLITFRPGTPAVAIRDLVLLSDSEAFTLAQNPQSGQQTAWDCRTTGGSGAPTDVGTFLLNADGLSFVAAATGHDFLPRLAECCLIIRGKDDSEATYLQLSRPLEIASVPFTLEPIREGDQCVLGAIVRLAIPASPGLASLAGADEAVLDISAAMGSVAPAITLTNVPFAKPTAGRQDIRIPIGQELVHVPLEYRVEVDGDAILMRVTVIPIADGAQFERLRSAIAKDSNINFLQTFWPYAKSVIARALSDALAADAKETRKQQQRVIGSLQDKLEPRENKPAAPFASYVEASKRALLYSQSLTSRAEAAIDKKHPPSPPGNKPKADTPNDPKTTKDEKPEFDRAAEVAKEKDSLFYAWAEDRLRKLEDRLPTAAAAHGRPWTDDELDDYVSLLLYARIQHLEKVVKALWPSEAAPAINGTASVALKRFWPARMLPKGTACRPITILLRTTPQPPITD